MAEESVAKLFAEISADVEDFEKGIDKVEDRLDDLEKKEVGLTAETKGVETEVSNLGTEMALLGGALTTVFGFLQQNSGALGALTSLAGGLIGAGLDSFIFDTLIPAWEKFWGAEDDVEEKTNKVEKSMEELIPDLILGEDGMLKLREGAEEADQRTLDLIKTMNDGRINVDDFGNALFDLGGDLFFYDGKTGDLVLRTNALSGNIRDLGSDSAITADLLDDVAGKWGVLDDEVKAFAEGGQKALVALLMADPERFPGLVHIRNVSAAYEEVARRIKELLITVGWDAYDFARAATLGDDVAGPITKEQLDEFLESGGV